MAVFLCVILLAVPVCNAKQYPVPSGSIVVGEGSATSTEYSLQASPAKGQGILKLDSTGVVGPDVVISTQLKISAGFGDAGFIYRSSNFATTNDTYGWYVGIMKTGVLIGYGTNSSVSAWHKVASVPMAITPGVWYTLKVIANGENHKVFVNGSQVIEVNNAHFNEVAGYAGLRVFKISTDYKDLLIE